MAKPDLKRNFEDFNKKIETIKQLLEISDCDKNLFNSIEEMINEYQSYLKNDIEDSINIIESIEEL